MIPYKNLGWDSNIVSYENGNDYIKIQFASGRWTLYTYTYQSAGITSIETMKSLAECWEGLNEFINRNKPEFSHKL